MMPWMMLAAAALAGPAVDAALAVESYPAAALAGRHAAASVLTMIYDPAGRLADCTVEATAGSGFLGAATCGALRGRAVAPARLADGSAAWSRVRVLVRYFSNDGHDSYEAEIARLGRSPDVELTAQRLPGGRDGAEAEVVVSADADGQVRDCAPLGAANPDLARLACASRAIAALPPLVPPLAARDGGKVPFVATLLVRFVSAR